MWRHATPLPYVTRRYINVHLLSPLGAWRHLWTTPIVYKFIKLQHLLGRLHVVLPNDTGGFIFNSFFFNFQVVVFFYFSSETEQQAKPKIGGKNDSDMKLIETKFQRDPLKGFLREWHNVGNGYGPHNDW